MLLDLRQMPDGSRLEADVCVVGAGPAGIVLARELARSSLKVVLLESGGSRLDPAVQALNSGDAVGLACLGITEGRSRALGGTTKLWAGQCLPLDAIDFERRDWVPHSGWPFDLAHLRPYYRRAEAFFHVDEGIYDETIYHRFGLVAPAWDADALRQQFTVYTPQVDIGRLHHRAIERAATLRLVTYATVTGIDTNEVGSRVEGVRVRSLCGRSCTVRARAVVLCAGGLENARILLNSEGHGEDGLGNRHDLVGRFFQDHPNAMAATLHDADTKDLQDRFRLLYARRHRFFPKFALDAARQRAARVLNVNAHFVFEHDGDANLNFMRAMLQSARRRQVPWHSLRQAGRFGREAGVVLHALRRRYLQGRSPNLRPSVVRLQCYLEQAPNLDSRVLLSDRRDAFGLRQIRLDWRLTPLEQATMQTMVETADAEIRRLGLGRLQPDDWIRAPLAVWGPHLGDSFHHAGTTRMADNPREGVTDRDGQVFGMAGLYLCGGSVFPTSGYANPTLTIAAMAMRLSDHLAMVLAGTSASGTSLPATMPPAGERRKPLTVSG